MRRSTTEKTPGREHQGRSTSRKAQAKGASPEPQREKAEPDDQRTQAPQGPGGRRSHRNGGTKAANGKEPQSHHKKNKERRRAKPRAKTRLLHKDYNLQETTEQSQKDCTRSLTGSHYTQRHKAVR